MIMLMSFIIFSDFSIFRTKHSPEHMDLMSNVPDEASDMENIATNLSKMSIFLSKWILVELIEVLYKFG